MLESMFATVSDVSVFGLLFLVGITLISVGRNILSSENKPWFRVASTVIFTPLWIAVLLKGSWLFLVAYIFVVTGSSLALTKYSAKEETLEKLQEIDESGMLGCFLLFIIPFTIFMQSIFFLFFQWIR
jgi:hypothetical protein